MSKITLHDSIAIDGSVFIADGGRILWSATVPADIITRYMASRIDTAPDETETLTIQDACRTFDGFPDYLTLAQRIAAESGYSVVIEYPLYLIVQCPNGERCTVARAHDDAGWQIQDDDGHGDVYDAIITDDDDPSGPVGDRVVDAIATFCDRGRYATAAERRKADRDEQKARTR